MIDLELRLVPVDGLDPLVQHEAGVVEEDVEAVVLRGERAGELANRGERREIDRHGLDASAGVGSRLDLGDRARGLIRVARRDDDVRTLARDPDRGFLSDAAVAAGDDRDLAREVGHDCAFSTALGERSSPGWALTHAISSSR